MDNTHFSRLYIADWRQFQDVTIDIHPKLTILTGANGAGKSTLLSFFSRHFGYQRAFLATPLKAGSKREFDFGTAIARWLRAEDEEIGGARIGEITYSNKNKSGISLPRDPSLHYSTNFTNQQFVEGVHIDSHRPPNVYRHVESYPSGPPSIEGLINGLNSAFIAHYSGGYAQYGTLHYIKSAIMQMAVYGYGNEVLEPNSDLLRMFKGFEQILRIMLPDSLGFDRLIIRPPEVLMATKSGNFLIDAASGGIIKLFEIAWQLFFHSVQKPDFVVTFDEPENHLHPSMQKRFLPSILEAFPKAQVIVATHSPFIISAVQDSFVYALRYVDALATDEEGDVTPELFGAKVVADKLDTINKAGSASEILRDVLGTGSTLPDWAERRVLEITEQFRGFPLTQTVLDEMFATFEKEGLTSSYPKALSDLTRAK